jgi:hypothetical protein
MMLITINAGIYNKNGTVVRDRYLTFLKAGKAENIDKRKEEHKIKYNAVIVELLCWIDTSVYDRDIVEKEILKEIKLKNLKCSIGVIDSTGIIFPKELALVTMGSIDVFIHYTEKYKYPLHKVSALIEDDTSEFIDDVYDSCVFRIQEHECTTCEGELQDKECNKCNDSSLIQDDVIVLCDIEDSLINNDIYIMSQHGNEWIEKNILNKKENKYNMMSENKSEDDEDDEDDENEEETEDEDEDNEYVGSKNSKNISDNSIYTKLLYKSY